MKGTKTMEAQETVKHRGVWEKSVDMEYLDKFEFEPLGNRHIPIKHSIALKKFKEKLQEFDLQIIGERGYLSPDAMKYVYFCDITSPIFEEVKHCSALSIGFINYNNRMKVFTGLYGEKIFNDAMVLFSETNDKTKHTTNVFDRLDFKIEDIITRFFDFIQDRMEEVEKWASYTVNFEEMNEFFEQFDKIISRRRMDQVRDYFGYEKERTGLTLFNTTVEVLSKLMVESRLKVFNKVRKYLNQKVGIS